MKDIGGRINCENLTPQEWELLRDAENEGRAGDGWFTPTPEQWLAVRGTLALVEIRRGFEVKDENTIQLGVAQIRLNNRGAAALEALKESKFYTYGKELTERQIERLFEQCT